MGNGASAGITAAATGASADDLKAAMSALTPEARLKLSAALSGGASAPDSAAEAKAGAGVLPDEFYTKLGLVKQGPVSWGTK